MFLPKTNNCVWVAGDGKKSRWNTSWPKFADETFALVSGPFTSRKQIIVRNDSVKMPSNQRIRTNPVRFPVCTVREVHLPGTSYRCPREPQKSAGKKKVSPKTTLWESRMFNVTAGLVEWLRSCCGKIRPRRIKSISGFFDVYPRPIR